MDAIDGLDRAIIAALQNDARTSNREIAAQSGVTEVTIASRIRSLEQRRVLRVVLQRDLRSMGYNFLTEVAIELAGRPAGAVASDLAAIDEVSSVAVLMGNPDILIHLLTIDQKHLLDIIERKIAPIDGISTIDANIVLEVVKLDPRYGTWSSK